MDLRAQTARLTVVGSSCAKSTHHALPSVWLRSAVVSRLRLVSLLGAVEHQLGALLQAQQMMQQKMLELMKYFESEKSNKSEKKKKKMEQLDWRAMGEMQQFECRLEVQVLERWRQREPDDEEGHDVCGGEHREGPECDL